MTIGIIGSGNIGSTLAKALLKAGHMVMVGVRFPLSEKSVKLATEIGEDRFNTPEMVTRQTDVIIIAAPAPGAIEAVKSLGNTEGKVIIDTMNVVMGRGPEGFDNTADAILANTQTRDVVKCFNTTGFENLANPMYNGTPIDMFVSGDSEKGKEIAHQLAKDLGFGNVWDLGGNDKFQLTEQLAFVWINLAMMQKQGRNIGLRIERRG